MSAHCSFSGCSQTAQQAEMRIKVWPPSDAPSLLIRGHLDCFESRRDPSVSPDPSREHGRIPAKARCVFCGHRLPIIGVHPYALEVGDESSPDRYWAHAECIEIHFVDISD